MQATIVFQQIWNAIHERTETGERRWRYIILEGSSRSSKTRSLIQAFYLYAYAYEKKRMSVWRDTAKDCRDTVGYDMGIVYPDMEGYGSVNYNVTRAVYSFPTKSVIEINGTDDPVKVHGYGGDVAWLNEPYYISRDTFDQLDQRTTDVVLIDWNPKQSHFIDDLKKDPRTIVLHNTFRDNPFCPAEQRRKILSYQPVSACSIVAPTEQEARREGKLTEQEAKAYDLAGNPNGFTEKQLRELRRCRDNEDKNSANPFNWDVYGLGKKGERPNRIFRWRKIPDEQYKAIDARIYYGVDWGTVDPWGILEAKYYDGALYLHQLNYDSENAIREKLTLTERSQVDGSESTDEDKEAAGGIVRWLFAKLRIDKNRECICDSNRLLKIRALRDAGYAAEIARKGPGSIIDGIDLLNNMRVYYTASSTDLEYEQENYSRKVDNYGKVLEEPEDVNNHLMDPARYVAQYLQWLGIIRSL